MAWLTNWKYRKSHAINPASSAGTGYQIRIVVYYGGGSDSGENVYVNGKCKTDFSDIRFTTSDGVTSLNYYLESYTASSNAVFWVKVNGDLSSTPQTIYVYYGNPSASSASSGSNTFLFFDDFNDSSISSTLWNGGAAKNFIEENNGTFASQGDSGISVSESSVSGFLRIWGTLATNIVTEDGVTCGWLGKGLRSNTTFNLQNGAAIETSIYVVSYTINGEGIGFGIGFIADKDNRSTMQAKFTTSSTYNIGNRNEISGTRATASFINSLTKSTGYKRWSLRKYNSSTTWGAVADGQSGTATISWNPSSAYLDIFAYGRNTGDAFDIRFNWIGVRKYVNPEPSHGSWGLEETPAGGAFLFNMI